MLNVYAYIYVLQTIARKTAAYLLVYSKDRLLLWDQCHVRDGC